MKNSPLLCALMLSSAVGLSACGGGNPAEPTAITEQNAVESSFDAYQLIDAMLANGSISSIGVSAIGIKSTGTNATPSIVELAVLHAQRIDPVNAFQNVGVSAVISDTVSCSEGGSSTLSLNDANNDGELNEADSLTITYNSCAEFGVVQSGQMAITNISFQDQNGLLSGNFGMTVSYANLTVTDAQGTYTINGQMSIAASVTGTVTSVSIAGSAFQVSSSSTSRQLGSFIASTSVDSSDATFVHSINATLSPDGWTVSTPISFSGTVGAYPSAGVMRIIDVNGAIATLTAQGTSVLIEFDDNGDGTPESSEVRNWADVDRD